MTGFSRFLRLLRTNASLSMILFTLRIVFALAIYIREDSDILFYLISSFGLLHLMKLGNMPVFQEMYNDRKDMELFKKMSLYSIIEFGLLFYSFLILQYDFSGYVLFVVIVVRHFSDYFGFYFLTIKRLVVSRLVLIFSEIILILLICNDTFIFTPFTFKPKPVLFIPYAVYFIVKIKDWRYLVVDGLSSMIYSYDILIIGMLNPVSGFISNFALLTRALNVVPRLQSLITEPYRLRDYSFSFLRKKNILLNTVGISLVILICLLSYLVSDIALGFLMLIGLFYMVQVFSRSIKNMVVRESLIDASASLTLVAFLVFVSIIGFAVFYKSIGLFLIAKISGTLIFIYGYVYLLRCRRRTEFS